MMRTLRKYALRNLPYVIVLWLCLKLGTAYRLADGENMAVRLMGMGQPLGEAFGTFFTGTNHFDWFVGIVGALLLRLIVYARVRKNAKFRRDREYGSARWGSSSDIAPFVNSQFHKNIILTGKEFLSMNTHPKNPAHSRNLNCCVIGSSGSGKTRFWLTPNLLQAHSSYVVVDPKGLS